jgi:kinesin family protein 22
MERILHLAQECKTIEKIWCAVKTSYFEIYNEKVTDLIELKEDLKVCEDANKKTAILGLSETVIKSFEDFKKLYEDRSKNRTTASTNLNARSSRSHAVLRVSIELMRNEKKYNGRLHLVDLAGSEDNRKTGNTGQRMVESSNINLSLFTLQRVVNALNEGQGVIPYRDSKLTRILKDRYPLHYTHP